MCLILLLFLFDSFEGVGSEDINKSMKRKMEELESYRVDGEVLINDLHEDAYRTYSIKEWYLVPDNVRLEIYSDDEDKGQVFIYREGKVQIFNPLIQEIVTFPEPLKDTLKNKFSFVFYHTLDALAKENFQLEKETDRYKLTLEEKLFAYEIFVYEDKKSLFGSELLIDKINFYRGDTNKEPELIYYLNEIEWNPRIDEGIFEVDEEVKEKVNGTKKEKMIKGIEEIDKEVICKIEEGMFLELDFDPLTIDHPSFKIFHIGTCKQTDRVSIKYTGPAGNLSFTQKKLEEKKYDKEYEYNNSNKYSDMEFIASDYENILKWHENGIKYTLIGDFHEKDLVEIARETRDLEI